MRTKEEIAFELGYRKSDSYGGIMWFKDGMYFMNLSDLPDIAQIEQIWNAQSTSQLQTIVCWILLLIDGLTVKYASTNFWEAVVFVLLGAASAALMLQSAVIWRKQ